MDFQTLYPDFDIKHEVDVEVISTAIDVMLYGMPAMLEHLGTLQVDAETDITPAELEQLTNFLNERLQDGEIQGEEDAIDQVGVWVNEKLHLFNAMFEALCNARSKMTDYFAHVKVNQEKVE